MRQAANATFGASQPPNNESTTSLVTTNRILGSTVIREGNRILEEGLLGPNKGLEQYQQIVSKAYGSVSEQSAKVLLEQARDHLEGSELKILMLMLQMRGQFDRTGGPMVSK